jgi:hypothetical protein
VNLDGKDNAPYSFVDLPRCRWNVLDMLELLGRRAIPVYMFYDIDMTWSENLRKKFAALGCKTSVTAILLKSIAIAQRAHPITRTALLPTGKLVLLNRIAAGFTVERLVKGEPAVFFGLIKEADSKPISQIARELQSYTSCEISENPELSIQDRFNNMPWLFRRIFLWFGLRFLGIRLKYMGATFGLSSLGKFGMKTGCAPSVSTSVFGVGQVEERPVAVDGKVEVRPILSLVLSFDHRVIDGGPAARFMQDVVQLLQGGLEAYVRDELEKLGERLTRSEVTV